MDLVGIISLAGTLVTILCAVIFVLGILAGLHRGWLLTLVRLGVIAVSFLFAFSFTAIIKGAFAGMAGGFLHDLVGEALADFPTETVAEVCGAVGSALIAPLVFSFSYFVADLILHIIFHIVSRPWRQSEDAPVYSRLIGAGIGAVSALVACTFLFLTFGGIPRVLREASDAMEASNVSAELAAPIAEATEVSEGKFMLSVLNAFGGGLFDNVSQIETSVGKATIRDEMDDFIHIIGEAQALPMDLTKYTTDDTDRLHAAMDSAEASVIIRPLLGAGIPYIASVATKGGSFFETDVPYFGEIFDPFFQDIYAILQTSNTDIVCDDLREIADLFEVMLRHGLFREFYSEASAVNCVASPGFLKDMREVLSAYPRFAPLVPSWDAVMLRALACTVNTTRVLNANPNAFNEVAKILNDIRAEDATAEALESKLQKLLQDSGVASQEHPIDIHGLAEQTAEIFQSAFANKDTITGDDVEDLLDKHRFEGEYTNS